MVSQYQYPPQGQPVYVQMVARPTNGIAVAAVVLGVVGFVVGLFPIAGIFLFWIPALLAIIFGFIGISTASRLGGLNRGQAIWGVILGFAAGPASFIALMVLVAFGQAVSHSR